MNVESRIQELVRAHLVDDHKGDLVRFIDELLALAADAGEIGGSLAGEGGLRFEIFTPGQRILTLEVPLSRAKTKLRMLCARLGVLCEENGSLQGTIFGGAGIIPGTAKTVQKMQPNQWRVRFMNTTSEQGLTITPEARPCRNGSPSLNVEERASEQAAER